MTDLERVTEGAALVGGMPSREQFRRIVATPAGPTDLVDYLRDKLDHADDVVCSCPDIDVSSAEDQATLPRHEWPTVKGYDARCPVHGPAGPQPSDYVVYSNRVETWADVELRPVPKKRWWRR